MDSSMAQADADPSPEPQLVVPAWKTAASWVCAVLLAAIFLVAGVWKLSDPLATEQRMVQALIPPALAMATALGAGIAEAFAGLLVLVPRWRRWGALLCGLMLVAFMVYIGANYTRLQGEDCSCFPWLKRAVGPGFFVSDALMLLLAAGAWFWSRPSESLQKALVTLGVVAVFAGAVYGVTVSRQSGIMAPATITVSGQAINLRQGKAFVYFFDPECAHCDKAARAMAKMAWKNVRLVAVPTTQQQWGEAFVRETKLPAGLSLDDNALRAVFSFTDPPYGVALEGGRQLQAFTFMDDKEVEAGLRKLGFIE